jgi:hypothetical protein
MRKKSVPLVKVKASVLPDAPQALMDELREWIQQARVSAARVVDEHLCALYWRIGTRIKIEILKDQRAEYGAGIVSAVGRQLEAEFGRGFSEKSLRHMIRFAEAFPDEEIVSALRRQLTWTHFKRLIYLDDPLKREFYVQMCRIEKWPTRTLDKKINSMLFERTALSKKPDKLIAQELKALREEDNSHRISCSAILICWTFWGFGTPMRKRI